jgi:hypothetical protein
LPHPCGFIVVLAFDGRFPEMMKPQLMPNAAVDHDRLTLQDSGPDVRVIAMRKPDGNQLSQNSRLTTQRDGVFRARVLDDHVLQDSKHPFGRLQHGETNVAPTTGHSHLTDWVDEIAVSYSRPLRCYARVARMVPAQYGCLEGSVTSFF